MHDGHGIGCRSIASTPVLYASLHRQCSLTICRYFWQVAEQRLAAVKTGAVQMNGVNLGGWLVIEVGLRLIQLRSEAAAGSACAAIVGSDHCSH